MRGAPDALRTADAQSRVPRVRGDRFGRADADPEARDAPRRPLNTDRGGHRVPRAGEGDEHGFAVGRHVEPAVLTDDRSHELAGGALVIGQQEGDDAGRLGRRRGMARRCERIGGCELGVLVQDLVFEPLQRGAGVEPELVAEHAPRFLEGLQGVRLSSRAVQREHQLCAKALAERMFGDEPLQLENDLVLAAELELGLNPLFDHRQTQLIEPGRLLAGERVVAEVGQRLATEESERLPELFRTGDAALGRRLSREAFEPTDVHRVPGRQPQEVAGVLRFDPLGAEPLPQCGDMAMERRLRRFRRALPPERLDAIVGGDDLVSVKQQEREQRAVLPSRRGQIDAVGLHLEPAQQPELHFVPIVSRRRLSPA